MQTHKDWRPTVTEPFSRAVGKTLRAIRRRRGLTLREVADRSGGRFKATSVASYERGERAIPIERFCELADFYEVPPERLLADVVRRRHGRAPVVVDISAVEGSGGPEPRAIAGFARKVLEARGGSSATIRLREGDLAVIATTLGVREDELFEAIRPREQT